MKKRNVLLGGAIALLVMGCGGTPAPAAPPVVEKEKEKEAEVVVSNGITLSASYTPLYFSPDGDGENDELTITLGVKGVDTITSWTFDILEPTLSKSGNVFKHFEGSGIPNQKLTWDGRSDAGELVQAATDYPYAFTVTGTDGKKSDPFKGNIFVDVLVVKDAQGRLKIQVPSIVFRKNAADFEDLPDAVIANNGLVTSRIAIMLNKFPSYRIVVEGHANPVNAPGTAKWAAEEKKENEAGSLSEQRAQAIIKVLTENGVSNNRLIAIGKGISEPVSPFRNTADWWKNRRVEFYLDKNR